MRRFLPLALGICLLWATRCLAAGQVFNMAQTLSDGAQRTTIAFAGLAMMTGNLEAQSFFPPGKVADYTGFQYLRDNDPDGMGHNTSFLTRVANNVIYILDDNQFAQLKTLAVSQQAQINAYGYRRFTLMKAFRRLLDGTMPAGSTGLDLDAVKRVSRELYLLDGQISFDRALLYATILNNMTPAQKAYLANMKGKGWNSWPDITNQQIQNKMRGLPQGTSVAVMTYAGDLFSWYAGSVEADVYFCPERHGTYYGSFYMKDAPAVGHEGYSINEQLTATAGSALCDSAKGYVTPAQAALMSSLVDLQRNNLYAAPTANIVQVRTQIATLLRGLLLSTEQSATVKDQVLALSETYGNLDGENNYRYATVFSQFSNTLTPEQKTRLLALRQSIMSGTYADGTPYDYTVCTTPFLYSAVITDTSVLTPYIGNTDFLFFPTVDAAFTLAPDAPVINGTVTFTNTSTGNPSNWAWDFGDGTTSIQRNPSHVYTAAGTYTVTLTAQNGGYSDSVSCDITIIDPRRYQPDLAIQGPNDADYRGGDIYNDDAAQTSAATTAGTVSYHLLLGNDGNTADTLTLTATAGADGWLVRYFDANGVDITAQVTGGGWAATLDPAATVPVRVDVTPGAAVKGNAQLSLSIGAVSGADGTKADTVLAVTTKQALQSVTLNSPPASPVLVGQPVTFTATKVGGGAAEYRFVVGTYVGGVTTWPTPLPAWQASNTFVWTPASEGAYRIVAYAREQGTITFVTSTILTYVVKAPLTAVALGVSPVSPQPLGKALTLTAIPTGGAKVEYEFKAKYLDGATTAWVPIQNWGTNASITWTPTLAKAYTIYLTAREQGAAVTAYKYAPSQAYTLSPSLSAVALTVTPTSPKALGSTLTLKAIPTGGTKVEYEFKAKYTDPILGVVWVNIQAFTLNAGTVTWTPAEARTYTIYVTAREQGTATYAYGPGQNFTITPALSSVSLQLLGTQPWKAGQPITLRATTVGGAKVEYEFKAKYTDGATTVWVPIQSFTLGGYTCAWTPALAKTYTVYVTAREQGTLSTTYKYASQNVSVTQ